MTESGILGPDKAGHGPGLPWTQSYVAIGLGSWLGGALVERVVDWALG